MKPTEKESADVDKAFTGMLAAAYGFDPNAPELKLSDRVKIWHDNKMSNLDIGKQMYGTILLSDARKERDAYIRGLIHGQALQEYKASIEKVSV